MENYFCLKMIVLLLLIFEINTAINPYGPAVATDFTGCINNLIEENFDKPGILVFGNSYNATYPILNMRATILKKIHANLNFAVQIATGGDEVKVCSSSVEEDNMRLYRDSFQSIFNADYFVIIVDDFQDFINIASKLIWSRSWNPQAKFCVIFINLTYGENENIQYVENILSCLFRYHAINVLVVIPQPRQPRIALIFSWKPYDPPRYCGYFNETAKNRLILENVCDRGVMENNTLMFYDKTPTNMGKCVIYILAIEKEPFFSSDDDDPNIEKVLVNELLTAFNLTIKYKILNEFRGERNTFGVWNGALKRLAAKEGHILLGGIYPDNEVHEDFETSYSYLADSYTWVVPRANPSPPRMALTVIYNTVVWISVSTTFFLCVLSWKILSAMSADSKYNRSFAHCFLNAWIVALGGSAYVRPVQRSLRIFFIFFNFYCILLIIGYQARLIDVLQNPSFENQVDSIGKLVETGLKFGGTEELRDLFSNSNDTLDKIIYKNWKVIENISDALINVAVHKNFSVFCSRMELKYLSAIMPELRDCFGKLQYYTFKMNTLSVPAEMITLRGFPFMSKFSAILGRFEQLGISAAVLRRFARFNLMKRTRLLFSLNIKYVGFRPLSIRHLEGGFLILILGMVSGGLVLLIEIFINRKYAKRYFSKLKY